MWCSWSTCDFIPVKLKVHTLYLEALTSDLEVPGVAITLLVLGHISGGDWVSFPHVFLGLWQSNHIGGCGLTRARNYPSKKVCVDLGSH